MFRDIDIHLHPLQKNKNANQTFKTRQRKMIPTRDAIPQENVKSECSTAAEVR